MGVPGHTRRSGLLLALAAALAGGLAQAAPAGHATVRPQARPQARPPSQSQVQPRRRHRHGPAHRPRKRLHHEARPRDPEHPWPGEGEPDVERVRRCILERETGGDYGAEDPTHTWFGAYQFQQRTADAAAQRMDRPDLVGVPPNQWLPEEQDAAFYLIYNRGQGRKHWFGGRIPCF